MTMQRWEPFRELRRLDQAMDNLWKRFGVATGAGAESWFFPMDVIQTDDNIVVEASLPGVQTDNISVSIEDDVLTINVEVPQPQAEKGTYIMRERPSGSSRGRRRARPRR